MVRNAVITVINEVGGIYTSAVLNDVSFIGKTERTATEKGIQTADYFTVRISDTQQAAFAKTVKEIAKQYLQAENGEIIQTESGEPIELYKCSRFALVPQKTLIAMGTVDPQELHDIVSLLKLHEVYTVISVKDNRLGSSFVRHWRCDCK